jgi:hypothetical protein
VRCKTNRHRRYFHTIFDISEKCFSGRDWLGGGTPVVWNHGRHDLVEKSQELLRAFDCVGFLVLLAIY